MFCNKCGNKLGEGDAFCSKCGNAVLTVVSVDITEATPVTEELAQKKDLSKTVEEEPSVSALRYVFSPMEKSFMFTSGAGFTGMRYYRITTEVTMESDHMEIERFPERFNNLPIVGYNEISSVDLGKKIPRIVVTRIIIEAILLILSLIFVAAKGIVIFSLGVAIEIYFGINTQISINLRDGRKTDIFTRDNGLASRFKSTVDGLIMNR